MHAAVMQSVEQTGQEPPIFVASLAQSPWLVLELHSA